MINGVAFFHAYKDPQRPLKSFTCRASSCVGTTMTVCSLSSDVSTCSSTGT
jgi:hypothetical protein